jgi:DNA-binding transcriptional LysR family regulator
MDRFDAMRIFTRVAERRSFTLAADDLGVPRSTATDAVKHLDDGWVYPCLKEQRAL